MDLVYYYPMRGGAPAHVAQNIFEYLKERREELPFDNLKLFVASKYAKRVQEYFSNFEVVTYKNMSGISRESVIHIPISPLIYPNGKFLLHLFAILKKMKLILHYHGDMRKEMYLQLKYEHSLNISYIPTYIALPVLLRSANKLIVNSYLMSNLVQREYGAKDVVVIPNGIDDFWFEDNKERKELEGEPAFFYHGRLSPEKGVDLLIMGFFKVVRNSSKAKLYIAGDGPQQKHLRNLCNKLGIEKNVDFLGFIDKKEIKSYLKSVDAAIYPSRWDNFSLAILEALSSAECPVYLSKQAGIYDFIVRDGYSLNTFEPTIENISRVIKDILNKNNDKQIIKQQKKFTDKYTWDRIIEQYIKLYIITVYKHET